MKNLFAGVDYFLLLKDSNVSFPGYQVAGSSSNIVHSFSSLVRFFLPKYSH